MVIQEILSKDIVEWKFYKKKDRKVFRNSFDQGFDWGETIGKNML